MNSVPFGKAGLGEGGVVDWEWLVQLREVWKLIRGREINGECLISRGSSSITLSRQVEANSVEEEVVQ